MLLHMQRIVPFSGLFLVISVVLLGAPGAHAQAQNRVNSIDAGGARAGSSSALGDTSSSE